MLSAAVSLPGAPSSVPTARRFAESLLTGWGQPDVAWTAAQVVSELTTNCALHARTAFSLTITMDDDRVRIEVADGSPAGVKVRAFASTSTTGRGLRMIDTLAESWGVQPTLAGKTVWAQLLVMVADAGRDDGDLDALLSSFEEPSVGPTPTSGLSGEPRLLLAA